jgi:hypothetical protein
VRALIPRLKPGENEKLEFLKVAPELVDEIRKALF